MAEFTQYRRKQIAELRPYEPDESMEGISISAPDKEAGSPKPGDMIARNPKNHADQWLVAAQYFNDNFEPLTALSGAQEATVAERAPVTDEELEAWAKLRADDAGHLARELIQYRRTAISGGSVKCSYCGDERVVRCSYSDCPFDVEHADQTIARLTAEIEALRRERDRLRENVSDLSRRKTVTAKYRDEFKARAETAEALLAKTLEGLREWLSAYDEWDDNAKDDARLAHALRTARALVEEIEAAK